MASPIIDVIFKYKKKIKVMTSIKVTYLALDYEDKFPITSADSFDNLKLALDNYCGADERNSGKCLGFTPYETKYGSDYEGFYEYECCRNGNDGDDGDDPKQGDGQGKPGGL